MRRVANQRDKEQAVAVLGYRGSTFFDEDRYALEQSPHFLGYSNTRKPKTAGPTSTANWSPKLLDNLARNRPPGNCNGRLQVFDSAPASALDRLPRSIFHPRRDPEPMILG